MMSNKKHEAVVGELRAQITAAEHEQISMQRGLKNEVELSLRAIRTTLRTSRPPKINASLQAYRIDSVPLPRRHQSGIIRTAHFTDADMILMTTQGWLEDRAHRFIVGKDTVNYSREAFNIDSQALGSRPVRYESLEEMTHDIVAVATIATLAGSLACEAENGWQHAYSEESLSRMFKHVPAIA